MTNAQSFIHYLTTTYDPEYLNTMNDPDLHAISTSHGAVGYLYDPQNPSHCTVQFKDQSKAKWEWYDNGLGNVCLNVSPLLQK